MCEHDFMVRYFWIYEGVIESCKQQETLLLSVIDVVRSAFKLISQKKSKFININFTNYTYQQKTFHKTHKNRYSYNIRI